MNETISRRRIDGLDDLANLIDVNFMRELGPENDARRGKVAPDRASRFHARKLRHLNIQNAHLWFVLQRELHGLLTVTGFEHRRVIGKLALQNLAQVMPLGYVVFSD